MSEVKKEFEEWWNTQFDSLDVVMSEYKDEQFSFKEVKDIAQKAWEESKRQELEKPLPTIEEMIGILAD